MLRRSVAAALLACGFASALEGGIERWVRDLAAEDPAVRDRAEEQLGGAGEEARPALEEASKSDDPEVAMRARRLLKRLETGPIEEPEVRKPQAGRRAARVAMTMHVAGPDGTAVVTQEAGGRVKVVETKKGGEPETFEAETPEEFAAKYPDVAKKYGIGEEGGGIRLGPPVQKLFPGGSPEAEELEKELERMTRELAERQRKSREELDKDLEELQRELEEALKDLDKPGDGNLLGVRVGEVDEALRYQLDLPVGGVLVKEVEEGSRADDLGLEPSDILLSVNGLAVSDAADIRAAMKAKSRDLEAEIIRAGDRMTLPGKK